MESKKFSFNQEDLHKIIQTFLYTMGSAAVACLLMIVANTEFPPEYAFLPGILNFVLYAAQRFLQGK